MIMIGEIIKRFLTENPFFISYIRKQRYYDDAQLDGFIRQHYGDIVINKGKLKKLLKFCYIYGGVRYNEFVAHRFEHKKWKERRKIIPCSAQNNLYYQVNPSEWQLLGDKSACYNFFKKYFQRDVQPMPCNSYNESGFFLKFVEFVEKHPHFVVKPMCGGGGNGVKLINLYDVPKNRENCFHELLNDYPKGFVLEERIIQVDELARFHVNSVNTVRIQTINYGGCIEVKWPCLRMGTGQSVVDNGSNGGIILGVDVKDGRTFGVGRDERGHVFSEHPDSKVRLDDFQIPRWRELCDLVKEMALLCPTWRIIGWDMALTDKGWVLVEANGGPELLYQYVSKGGFYDDFIEVRKRLGARRFKGFRSTNKQFMPIY